MSTTYKLTYFDMKGLGEPIRFMLSYMGKDFEDVRVTYQEWQQMKKDFLFGKLPVLDVGDQRLYQSTSTMRYLARSANLVGSNDWENLQIDIVVANLMDLVHEAMPAFCEQDASRKEEIIRRLRDEHVPFYMEIYSKLVEKNMGYFANGKLSWAELFFFGYIDTLEELLKVPFIDDYPNLKMLREKVYAIPNIKKWIDRRPTSMSI